MGSAISTTPTRSSRKSRDTNNARCTPSMSARFLRTSITSSSSGCGSDSSKLGEDIPADIQGQDMRITFVDRLYRVRGWQKPLNPETLKVNVMVSKGDRFHVDTLDLYQAKARTAFIRQAGMELGVGEDALKQDSCWRGEESSAEHSGTV